MGGKKKGASKQANTESTVQQSEDAVQTPGSDTEMVGSKRKDGPADDEGRVG